MFLSQLRDRSGLSYSQLERMTRDDARPLTRSTLSEVLRGNRPPQKSLVESLLAALQSPLGERARIMDTWARLTERSQEWRTNLLRFVDSSPRELGVHAGIRPATSPGELPGYVMRSFDPELRRLIEDGTRRGCFVVLVGGSSTGKTRSLYEAVRNVAGDWGLVQPSDTGDIYRLLEDSDRPSIVWLDELTRFFRSTPELTKTQLAKLRRIGHIIVGTLWFEDYTASQASRVERAVLEFAEMIDVPRYLDADECERARRLASTDSSISAALNSGDDGMTQVLAAGPELLRLWHHAPPYARAAIEVATDARRLGILTPLSRELLLEAMAGYLGEGDRVTPPESWWQEVTSYAERPINETTVAALIRVAGRSPGTLAGYRAADYLAQHLRVQRRSRCPPESFWIALIDRLNSVEDIRRLRDAAAARMRYRLQEKALRKLAALGDQQALVDLTFLLVRQDRIGAAVSVLSSRLGDRPAEDALAEVFLLRGRADAVELNERADLLCDLGERASLRGRADQGDATAADDLADLLAERGELAELRRRADRGHSLAADLLAELLAIHRRTDELSVRAAAGDQASLTRLNRLRDDASSVKPEIQQLREALARGEVAVAERLTSLLFELADEPELRAEVDAGTPYAADRLLALLAVNSCNDPEAAAEVVKLRALGMHCDGTLALTEGQHHA
ncbi:helix-turn-helix transcriptional regulator [Actinoplanes sp. NPDC051346]|uniref:helix-turn-helix domain-containing protein n=1 Tax=Actinoplanes sp. NPDC051346 TaxID=3155048 RepID=UPI003448D989